MARERIVVGIDVGTTKVCVIIAAVSPDDQLEILGAGISQSRGLRRGVVVNVDEAAQAISSAVHTAEQQSGYKIMSAFVGISGAHISSTNSHGVVAVRRSDNVITEDDIDRALEAARVVTLPHDRDVIHVIPRNFVIDGQEGITHPAGMLGRRLEVETTVVTGTQTAIGNLTRCVEQAGLHIDNLVVQPVAAGESTLTTAEKDMGVILVDIGGGSTDAAVFIEGSAAWVTSIPVGGNHISNDISVGLRTPFGTADELKVRFGHAHSPDVDEDEIIDIGDDEGDEQPIAQRDLAEVIEARLEETFELLHDQLSRAGFADGLSSERGGLPGGIVLVGGTAQLPGMRKLAGSVFGTSVRIATPTGMFGLVENVNSPAFATSVGLLKWGLTQFDDFGVGPDDGVWNRFRRWLRGFFP